MNQLEEVIRKRPEYLEHKERHLAELAEQLDRTTDERERFDALTSLYDEYHSFNADSAYSIS
ncbi:MAG: hypothetical protein K2H03_04610, partial [Muribaculaceae bacterium]|nr:hypothetical protein [Muribaculaceae bacterium]